MKENFTIGNENLEIAVNPDTLGISLRDLSTGAVWASPVFAEMCYGDFYLYRLTEHCRARVKKEQDRITVAFDKMTFWARFRGHGYVKPDPGPDLKFGFSIILKNDHAYGNITYIPGSDPQASGNHTVFT